MMTHKEACKVGGNRRNVSTRVSSILTLSRRQRHDTKQRKGKINSLYVCLTILYTIRINQRHISFYVVR